MSAFIVSEEHIDYLVRCAVEINRATYPRLYWDHTPICVTNASFLGQQLWRANIASVAHRYPNDAADSLPGPVPTPAPTDYEYRNYLRPFRFEPVQLIKAIQCFEYQSNERPEWEDSEAHAFCECLMAEAIARLPGYDQAAWEIEAVSVA